MGPKLKALPGTMPVTSAADVFSEIAVATSTPPAAFTFEAAEAVAVLWAADWPVAAAAAELVLPVVASGEPTPPVFRPA